MSGPILVVDDEPDMCWAMDCILSSQGYSVVTATSGEQALATLDQHDFFFVFMDAKLPDMDGLDVVRQARQLRSGSVRTVLVSGFHYHDDPIIRQSIEIGLINGFLAKPFAHNELLEMLPRPDSPASDATLG
ncbi:MAG: response regulator [Methylococcus sp.]